MDANREEGKNMKLTAIFLAAVAFVLVSLPIAFSQSANIQVNITNPSSGAVVPRQYTVRGESRNIGQSKILLFVYAPGAKKWFFQDTAKISGTGSWQGNVIIGAPGDVGAEFRVVATVMANVPKGLSELSAGNFPLAGTLAQTEAVTVKRGQ